MVDNCTDVTVVNVTVKKVWVSNLCNIKLSIKREQIENVSIMSFMEAGKQEMVPKNF